MLHRHLATTNNNKNSSHFDTLWTSGSQPGCRGTQGCREIVSGVPPVIPFYWALDLFTYLGVPPNNNKLDQGCLEAKKVEKHCSGRNLSQSFEIQLINLLSCANKMCWNWYDILEQYHHLYHCFLKIGLRTIFGQPTSFNWSVGKKYIQSMLK